MEGTRALAKHTPRVRKCSHTSILPNPIQNGKFPKFDRGTDPGGCKSSPGRDADVMKRYERLQWVSWFYQGDPNPFRLLGQISAQYGVTHVVTERNYRPTQYDSLQVVYKDAYYCIYALAPKK
jgi:hypothetical protein